MDIQISTKLNPEALKKEIVINSQTDYQQAGDVLKACKNKLKDLDEERKTYTKPIDESKKLIIAKFKEVTEPLDDYINRLSAKMGQWYETEQAKRTEQQKKLEQKAIEKAGDNPDVEVPVVPDAKSIKGDSSTTTMVAHYDFKVIDESKVPREYLSVDDKKVKAVLKYTKHIEGIKIIKSYKPKSR